MLVLALDTSTPAVTAGVVMIKRPHELISSSAGAAATDLSPVQVLSEHSVTDQFAHAEHAMPLVKQALTECGHTMAELEAVVVGLGPGPFTGLRVGIATAAALGDALDLPVHGVPSHDAVAAQVVALGGTGDAGAQGEFLVVTDARRREVYLSAYDSQGRRLAGPLVVAPAAVAGLLTEHSLAPGAVFGAGAGLLASIDALPASGEPAVPGSLAVGLVTQAARRLLTGAVPGPLTPLYLRRPDAVPPKPRVPATPVR